MSDIPKLGTKDQIPPNDTTNQQDPRNGLVTFYATGAGGTMPAVISINGDNGGVDIGGKGEHGKLLLRDKDQTITYILDGETGAACQGGDICLFDEAGNERLCISGKTASLTIKTAAGDLVIHLNGEQGDLTVGGKGQDGGVIVRNSAGDNTIRLDGDTGNVTLGGGGQDGDIIVRNGANVHTIRLDGDSGDLSANGTITGQELVANEATINQDLTVNGSTTTTDLTVNGNLISQDLTVNGATDLQDLTVAGTTTTKDIAVTNAADDITIELDGEAGDIRLLAADCAEDFDVVESDDIGAGTVMVLDQEGRLCPSTKAYDKKVAGVISGAGDHRPGIILDQQRASQINRLPVALMGKVYCKVDASFAPIDIGDLLTTAHTPGHAMKATDPSKAFGAVIGKSLRPLESGTGLVPILVALQ